MGCESSKEKNIKPIVRVKRSSTGTVDWVLPVRNSKEWRMDEQKVELIPKMIKDNHEDIVQLMTDNKSIMQYTLDNIMKQFDRFGLVTPEMGQMVAQEMVQASTSLTASAVSTSIEMVKIRDGRERLWREAYILDQKIAEGEIQREILTYSREKEKESVALVIEQKKMICEQILTEKNKRELIVAQKDKVREEIKTEKFKAKLIDMQGLKTKEDVGLVSAQKEKLREETKAEEPNRRLIEAKIKFLNAQKEKEAAGAANEKIRGQLLGAQQGLVLRQTRNYGDNLLVRAAEFQSNVASFAASSHSKEAQAAIAVFNGTVAAIIARAGR